MEILLSLLPEKIQNLLKEEEDEAKQKKVLEKYLDEAKQMAVDKAIKDFKKDYEKEFGEAIYEKATEAVKNKLRKVGGFTSDEVKDKKAIDLIDDLEKKTAEKIKEAAEGKNEDYVKKIEKLEDEIKLRNDDIDALKSKVEEAEKQSEREIKKFRIKQAKANIYGSINFDDPDKAEIYTSHLDRLTEDYQVDPETLEIKNPDGSRVQAPDGSGYWDNLRDPINYYTNKYKMVLKSNAGGGANRRKAGDNEESEADLSGVDALKRAIGQ